MFDLNVQIITDSASDLSRSEADKHGIDFVPLTVTIGDNDFQDGITLEPVELFQGMREGKSYRTSQPSVGAFEAAFRKYAETGTPCVYIAFSSELSGTYQSGLLAREQLLEEFPDLKLEVIDSKCASAGLGLVALHAAELAKNGASFAEIVEASKDRALHMEHIFTVDKLDYLVRGGRVSPVAAFIGGILNIKPILHVDSGKLIPIEKVRGRKKVLARIIEILEERGSALADQTIGISHGDDIEDAKLLQSMIAEKFGCSKFFITMIGASIGAHAGPGTLSVFFLNKTY